MECWLASFVIFRGFEPVLLRNPTFFDFSGGGGPDPCPPLDPRMIYRHLVGQEIKYYLLAHSWREWVLHRLVLSPGL